MHIQLTCDQLVILASSSQTVKTLRRLAYEFEMDQIQRQSSQIHASQRKLALTYVDLRVRLVRALY